MNRRPRLFRSPLLEGRARYRRGSPAASERRQRGLTLLEVLAATMIFATVMTVLISSSSMSVRRSGISARRLEANLIAESALADLEIEMKRRQAPEIEEEERTQDDFTIRIQRVDLGGDEAAATSTASLSVAGADPVELIGAQLPEVAKHLKRYDIEVSWIGGAGVADKVTRTTFAFDWQAASVEYAALFQDGGPDAATPPLDDAGQIDPSSYEGRPPGPGVRGTQ